jgi:hypothetical protein
MEKAVMKRTWLLAGLLAALVGGAGCSNTGGLCASRKKPQADDTSYTIAEQKRRARDKGAIPQGDDFRLGPPTGSDLPGGIGR